MVSNCDFELERHAFLGQYCYFYNDFTIKASLLNLIQSAIAAFIYLSSYVLYLYAFALLAMQGWRFTKTVISFVVASFIGLVAFVPWLLVIIANFSHIRQLTV